MRNGDFLPTRIQAQQDAVGVICHAKTRQNPENNVALLTLARSVDFLVRVGRILSVHIIKPFCVIIASLWFFYFYLQTATDDILFHFMCIITYKMACVHICILMTHFLMNTIYCK